MTIDSLSGVSGFQRSQNVSNAGSKLQAVISGIVSGQSDDSASVSIATQLQARTAALRQASNNLAQASSLTQVADGGVQQIQAALGQLQSIAQQAASPLLNDANRADLNAQFNQLVQTISRIASDTTFNGQSLLDGNLTGGGSLSIDSLLGAGTGADSLSISNLTAGSLLTGLSDLLTPASAAQSLGAVNAALTQVNGVRSDIGSFQQSLGFATANVESAIINQEAAQSDLSDTDLADASVRKAQAEVQRNASVALAAQGNNLTPVLLKLVG
jgi:flagellin